MLAIADGSSLPVTLKLRIMQESKNLTEQYLQILQAINKKLDRQEFCQLHQISESKLSRILAGKVQPDFELLDYMAIHCGMKIRMFLEII